MYGYAHTILSFNLVISNMWTSDTEGLVSILRDSACVCMCVCVCAWVNAHDWMIHFKLIKSVSRGAQAHHETGSG